MNNRADIFLEKYRVPLPEYLIRMKEYADKEHIPVMARSTGDILRYIIRTHRPERILEIGTAIGYSALFMCSCDTSVRVTTIEKIPSRYEMARESFEAYDPDGRITLICEDAMDALEKLQEKDERFGVIFLDAAKGQYKRFLPMLVRLLDEGGILVTDNIFHNGAVIDSRYVVSQRDRTIHDRMREFLKNVAKHEELESICVPVDDGVMVVKKQAK